MDTKEVDIKRGLPEQWDEEADVVVVGFGGAGAVAAIAARDAGAEVLVLEKQSPDKHTPSTMMSAAGCHVANDAREAARYFKAVAFGIGLPDQYGDPARAYPCYPLQLVEEHAAAWAEGVLETADFLNFSSPACSTISNTEIQKHSYMIPWYGITSMRSRSSPKPSLISVGTCLQECSLATTSNPLK